MKKSLTSQLLTCAFIISTLASCSTTTIPTTSLPTATTTQTNNSVSPIATNLIQGAVKLIPTELNLFVPTDDPYLKITTTYYEAGTFAYGKYQGFKRIVALREPNDPTGPQFFTFATKDNEHYIADNNQNSTVNFDQNNNEYLMNELNTKKVINTDTIESSLPLTLKLDQHFSLYKAEPYYTNDEATNTLHLVTDFTGYTQLAMPQSNLRFYAIKSLDPNQAIINNIPANLTSRSSVIIVDATGLAYTYHLASTDNLNAYPDAKKAFDKAQKQYDQMVDTAINNSQPQPTITPPTYVRLPNLRFSSSNIGSKAALFKNYDAAFIPGCSQEIDTLVISTIKESELKKVGTLNGGDVFALNNPNHPLIKQSYEAKIANIENQMFKDYNQQKSKPTINTYAAQNPLLFIHDTWNRLLMLQESDYAIPQECGKPVLYFYPPQPTTVQVQFTKPIDFSTTIPTYHNGWKFVAEPNGTLHDKQTQFTDCNAIDSQKTGSEYATKSCLENTYPYMYWAGKVVDNTYPLATKGWVVANNELESFLNNTLDAVGFSQQEKADMLAYWLPQMKKSASPYYRISFLQTNQLNQLAPMQITPAPNSLYRLFLDYLPLEKPLPIEPQTLEHIQRTGFTVVEWGGLKR